MIDNPVYIQFHIPRTGGTTLLWKLGNPFERTDDRWLHHYTWTYPQDYQYHNVPVLENRTQEQQQQIKFITGQSTFDMCHNWLRVEKTPYQFTFVRDPIDRVLSSFNYRNGMTLLNQDWRPFTFGGPDMIQEAKLHQKTAEDYDTLFDWYCEAPGEHNLQCKWLLKSFYTLQNGKFISHKDLFENNMLETPGIWPWWFNDIEMNEELFDLVIDIVGNKMWWCGTSSTLTEDIKALCKYTDTEFVNVDDKHISGEDYPVFWNRTEIESQTNYEQLVKSEQYDIRLYNYIKENCKRPF
jgi:hypothetical protein